MATQCFLQCLNGSHDDILLEDLKPSIFGRMPHTKIKDKRCSKNQGNYINLPHNTCQVTEYFY